jgi:hypothetical protein
MKTVRDRLLDFLIESLKWDVFEYVRKQADGLNKSYLDNVARKNTDLNTDEDFLKTFELKKLLDNMDIETFMNLKTEEKSHLDYYIDFALNNIKLHRRAFINKPSE